MSDPYSSIAAQPSEVTDKLAGVLEMRAAQTEQTHLRDHLLMQKLHGSVLEIGAGDRSGCQIAEGRGGRRGRRGSATDGSRQRRKVIRATRAEGRGDAAAPMRPFDRDGSSQAGTGAITRAIAALTSVTKVTGLDPSAAFLDAARANAGPKEIYVEGYSTSLPVADASADAVVLWTTLSHIPVEQHAESYAEILRVLKPGGVLHVFDRAKIESRVATTPSYRAAAATRRCHSSAPRRRRGSSAAPRALRGIVRRRNRSLRGIVGIVATTGTIGSRRRSRRPT